MSGGGGSCVLPQLGMVMKSCFFSLTAGLKKNIRKVNYGEEFLR